MLLKNRARTRVLRHLSLRWLTFCSVSMLAAATPALAFWPTSLYTSAYPGGAAVSHEKMTLDAIGADEATIGSSLNNEFFGATRLKKGLKDAAEEIADANAATDEDQSPHLHFDAENFGPALDHIKDMVSGIVLGLAQSDVHAPRTMLGRALHTLQDFFAHSNWIELHGNRAVSCPALIPPFSTPFAPSPVGNTVPVCTLPALTSGYYGDSGAPLILEKFIHGGVSDSLAGGPTVYCEWLNKDSDHSGVFGAGAWTHFPALHPVAAEAAAIATREFIRGIRDALVQKYGSDDGDDKLRKLFGADSSLRVTNDNLRSAVDFLITLDGRELDKIVNLLSKRTSSIFMPDLTGAASHVLIIKATASESVTGIAAYTLVLPHQYQFDSVESDLTPGVSVAIGGQTHSTSFLIKPLGGIPHRQNKYRISRVPVPFLPAGAAAVAASQVDSVDLLSIEDTALGTSKLYLVPVDATLTDLALSFNGTNGLSLKRPDGTAVQAADTGVLIQTDGLRQSISVLSPTAGKWTVLVSEGGSFDLQIAGRSPLALRQFNFVKQGGRGGHEGFFKMGGEPVAGQTNNARAELSEGFATAQFELRNREGKVLQVLPMDPAPAGPTNRFFGKGLLPTEPFVVYVTGKDKQGKSYQRVQAGAIKAQTVFIEAPPFPKLLAGKATTLTFKLTNVGDPDVFSVSTTGDRGYVKSITPANLTLGLGQTKDVVLEIQPPANEPPGTPFTLRLISQSSTHPETRNSTVLIGAVFEAPPANIIQLSLDRAGSDILLYWTGTGVLQAADALGGSWQDLTGEESPYLIPQNGKQRFYRVFQK